MIKLYDDGIYILEASVKALELDGKYELSFNRQYEGQKFGETRHVLDGQALQAFSEYIKLMINTSNVTGKNHGNH